MVSTYVILNLTTGVEPNYYLLGCAKCDIIMHSVEFLEGNNQLFKSDF